MEKRVGLAVGRFQPLHLGHCSLVSQMCVQCDIVLIGIGSVNNYRTAQNPYSYEERVRMLHNVYSDRLHVFPLLDKGFSADTNQWVDCVLQEIQCSGLPAPTDYYCGRIVDAAYYWHRFQKMGTPLANKGGNVLADVDLACRRLHIVSPIFTPTIPATEIRRMLEAGNVEWVHYVPHVNRDLIISGYHNYKKFDVNICK